MNRLPIGIQTFRDIIKEDYLYIDKTEEIHKLFADGGKYYFLSRPRRFGKSLLISTLKEIFSGNKELFKGLWIYDKIHWGEHPIIHIDFLGKNYKNKEELLETIDYILDENAAVYGITLKKNSFDKKFSQLIKELAKINRVVILIDEYDKPIIANIKNLDIAEENRVILKTFYEGIKAADQYLKFAFITGVSKFSRVSIFSGLNNLTDITISDEFSTLLGYTEKEMESYFQEETARLAERYKMGINEIRLQVRNWYNGYSWDGENFMYNPYSILRLFKDNQFDNYWFSSGTPTFLMESIRERGKDIREYDGLETSGYLFDQFELDNIDLDSLLFQTGYLTIKKRVINTTTLKTEYTLTYPNKEVRESFLMYLFNAFNRRGFAENEKVYSRLNETITNDNLEGFFRLIKSFFASVSYNHFIGNREAFYQSILYTIIRLIGGVRIETEIETNVGRIDAVVETQGYFYIMEFKMGTAEKALSQIKNKKYYEKYLMFSKPVKIVGVGFDKEEKNIADYLIEEIK
ncbi:MAG: AAA family ATPase [bacterium]|nr:AAA family ATPase [bacterium]